MLTEEEKREQERIWHHEYYKRNAERLRAAAQESYRRHREERLIKQREYRKRLKADPIALEKNLRRRREADKRRKLIPGYREAQRAYYRKYYRKRNSEQITKDKEASKANAAKKRVRANKYKVKAGAKCCICGYDESLKALCFHHIIPTTKKTNLAILFWNGTDQEIEEEIQKCILVCANCHMSGAAPTISEPKIFLDLEPDEDETINLCLEMN